MQTGHDGPATLRPALGQQRGFSLIEVMVSLIIIAVGLLGIAKMEALAYSSTGIANKRSIAAIEASSLASAMSANRSYWAGGLFPVTPVTITGATINNATITGAYKDCTSGAVPICTNAQLAAYDLQQWANALQAVLPSDRATITCPAPAATFPVNCTIFITWSENLVGSNPQGSNGTMQTPDYTLYVQP